MPGHPSGTADGASALRLLLPNSLCLRELEPATQHHVREHERATNAHVSGHEQRASDCSGRLNSSAVDRVMRMASGPPARFTAINSGSDRENHGHACPDRPPTAAARLRCRSAGDARTAGMSTGRGGPLETPFCAKEPNFNRRADGQPIDFLGTLAAHRSRRLSRKIRKTRKIGQKPSPKWRNRRRFHVCSNESPCPPARNAPPWACGRGR